MLESGFKPRSSDSNICLLSTTPHLTCLKFLKKHIVFGLGNWNIFKCSLARSALFTAVLVHWDTQILCNLKMALPALVYLLWKRQACGQEEIYFSKKGYLLILCLLNQLFSNVGLQSTDWLRWRFNRSTQNEKNMDKAVSFFKS